jgi:hypothetical protein
MTGMDEREICKLIATHYDPPAVDVDECRAAVRRAEEAASEMLAHLREVILRNHAGLTGQDIFRVKGNLLGQVKRLPYPWATQLNDIVAWWRRTESSQTGTEAPPATSPQKRVAKDDRPGGEKPSRDGDNGE